MNELFKSNYFDELMDSVALGFGRPFNIRFNTPLTKDMCPATPWKKEDEYSYSTVVRMLGINPEDVNITLEEYGLSVQGESETYGGKYSQHVDLGISKDLISNIKEVNYSLENGLCKIVLQMNEPVKKEVKISRV